MVRDDASGSLHSAQLDCLWVQDPRGAPVGMTALKMDFEKDWISRAKPLSSLACIKKFHQGEHTMPDSCEEVYSSLHRRFNGDLLRPGDDRYEEARVVWNGMTPRPPRLIARCSDVSDVPNPVPAPPPAVIVSAFRCGRR